MRIKIFLVLFLSIAPLALFGQQDTTVTIQKENVALKEILEDIQSESSFSVFYNKDLPVINKTVTVKVRNTSVAEVLDSILLGTELIYKVLENKFVVIAFEEDFGKHEVSGQVVSSENGETIPGVHVYIKGSSTGTISDIDGKFNVLAPGGETILVFSFIGYDLVEIPAAGVTQLMVRLKESAKKIKEVVVVALNIARDKSSLGYSVTQVNSEEIAQVKQNNPINSLAGKVAGLQISGTPSGVDGSSRVVLRGISSLSSGNRPLIIIDGIPVSGGSYGGASEWGGTDKGDALSDINPADVESISVLKGAGAAAIYGSRGANGVILITTKKGKKRKGLGISFNSSFLSENPMQIPELQNEYGQGAFGRYPSEVYGKMGDIAGEEPWIWSWGSKMDGSLKEDWLGNEIPYESQPNYFREFYRTGHTLMNTLAFDGGNENSTFRASVTNQKSSGIYPDNDMTKQTFNMYGLSKFGESIELNAKITYIHSEVNNRPYLAEDPANAGWSLGALPRNVVLETVEDHATAPNGSERWAWDRTVSNPYWTLQNKKNHDEKNRVQGLVSLQFELSESFNLLIRSGLDLTNRNAKEYAAGGSYNHSSFQGYMSQNFSNSYEWNNDFLATYKQKLGQSIKTNISLGGNYRYNQWKGIGQSGSDWKVSDFYHISNTQNYSTWESFSQKEVLSLYGIGTISLKNYLYFDLTYRTDWSSTLPAENDSYSFYSGNISFLFSEVFNMKSPVFSRGKIRASIARVGNDAGSYQTTNYYSVGQSSLPYPIGSMSGRLAFQNFKPEITDSYEFGTNLSFFRNRLEFDFSYYDGTTKNQIMPVELAPSSGFSSIMINAGEVRNHGFEVLFTGSALSQANFNWDITLNFSRNISEVVSLYEDVDRRVILEAVTGFAFVELRPGDPFGSIYGYDYARNEKGEKLINKYGYPIKSEYKKLGDINPDLIGGLSNRFRYRNFSLNFLIDFQIGGEYYSATKLYHDLFGTSLKSIEGRDQWYSTHEGLLYGTPIQGVVPRGYVEEGVNAETGEPNDVAVQPMLRNVNVIFFEKIVSDYIIDASNIRMRELSISYDLPADRLNGSFIKSINISLIARNLFFFYNASGDYDPESGFNSGSIGNAFELNPMPSTRSVGFSLNINF
ncbi:MAG: SusC/RagA family TonB-linked outer membrane protein [Bacteroidota bacterium]|nr:SusC/RagA family TonB-linked outer membrane protein [Bacteroidota bacterium]